MDPDTGDVMAMTSYPTYDPSMLADGFSFKDQKLLAGDPGTNQDDALTNRAMASEQAPGSTFKPVTAGAALANGVIGAYDGLDCPGSKTYPPEGGPGSVAFPNWTSADIGFVDVPTSLEISCNTFYYELGWRMEDPWGQRGDGTERFQNYQRHRWVRRAHGHRSSLRAGWCRPRPALVPGQRGHRLLPRRLASRLHGEHVDRSGRLESDSPSDGHFLRSAVKRRHRLAAAAWASRSAGLRCRTKTISRTLQTRTETDSASEDHGGQTENRSRRLT